MRTASVRELQHHLKRVLDAIDHGEEVVITRRHKQIAKIIPMRESSEVLEWPDFIARARRAAKPRRGKAPSELIIESREERL